MQEWERSRVTDSVGSGVNASSAKRKAERRRESGTKWDELSLKIYCSHCKLRTERTLTIGTHFLISFLPFGGRSTAVKISKQNRNRNKNFELSTPFAVASRAVCANVCVCVCGLIA